MFLSIIKNANNRYEIRRWGVFGWSYYDREFEGGTWWPGSYRGCSTKYHSLDDAKNDLKSIMHEDEVVWP